MYTSKIGAQIGATFKTTAFSFLNLIWHSVLAVPRWITIGLPVLAVGLFLLWLWYNFIR